MPRVTEHNPDVPLPEPDYIEAVRMAAGLYVELGSWRAVSFVMGAYHGWSYGTDSWRTKCRQLGLYPGPVAR